MNDLNYSWVRCAAGLSATPPGFSNHSINVLSGTDSFTTCQALWFGANGEVVIANAGHLPPYLNSQEIALPGSLPAPASSAKSLSKESRFFLHPGNPLFLLLSDGVVEARHPNGELFGFDRVRQFSQKPAVFLADAAKSFGQQDKHHCPHRPPRVEAVKPSTPAPILSSG